MALRAYAGRMSVGWRRIITAGCAGIDRWSIRWAMLAGWLVLGLALLTVGLVIARYGFAWTHNGWDELRWHLFGAIFLLAMAGCLAANGHVRVDVVQQRLPVRMRAAIELLLTLVLLLPWCVIMIGYGSRSAYQAWHFPSGRSADHWALQWSDGDTHSGLYRTVAPIERFARATLIHGERSANEGGLEARWVAKALIPVGFVLLAIQALAHAGRQVLILLPEPMAEEGGSSPAAS